MTENTIPYFEDKNTPFQDDRPVEERTIVIAIIYNKQTDEVLCLDWPQMHCKSFLSGGIEVGEDTVQTALREIYEETGYKNLEFVQEIGRMKSAYFAGHKNVNRVAHNTGLLFYLHDLEADEIAEAETLHQTAHWIKKDDVKNYITIEGHLYLWSKALEVLK
jgi:8-oxo-dGTP pyrophosphatase MutT (NUDIX family)